jgi:hypothetical protein
MRLLQKRRDDWAHYPAVNHPDESCLGDKSKAANSTDYQSEETGGAEGAQHDKEGNACPCCGGRMIIVETFEPGCQPRLWPIPAIGLDSS